MKTSKTIPFMRKDRVIDESKLPLFSIGKRKLGRGQPCFITAEIGINFDGNWSTALKMIDAAADAGCDAVKFQVFRAEHMYIPKAGELVTASGKKVNIRSLLKKVELDYDWLHTLREYAEKKKLEFFASACDEASADALYKAGTSAFKITSYEMTHIPLIEHVSSRGLPLIISCGGNTMDEVVLAIRTAQQAGQKDILLMHCIAKYDAPLNALHLNVLKTLQLQFPDVLIGYSDHSADPVLAPVAAVALGAKMVEKHITLDRRSPGPDHSFALEPHQLKHMVELIRKTEAKLAAGKKVMIDPRVLGRSDRSTFPEEVYIKHYASRMCVAAVDIKRGEKFSAKNVVVLRPGELGEKYAQHALYPSMYSRLLGKRDRHRYVATKAVKAGEIITWGAVLQQSASRSS
jgi:sialic acid synthase SpsE